MRAGAVRHALQGLPDGDCATPAAPVSRDSTRRGHPPTAPRPPSSGAGFRRRRTPRAPGGGGRVDVTVGVAALIADGHALPDVRHAGLFVARRIGVGGSGRQPEGGGHPEEHRSATAQRHIAGHHHGELRAGHPPTWAESPQQSQPHHAGSAGRGVHPTRVVPTDQVGDPDGVGLAPFAAADEVAEHRADALAPQGPIPGSATPAARTRPRSTGSCGTAPTPGSGR